MSVAPPADAASPAIQALLERPVFVAGRGRSGSSLLLRLFDGHPEVFAIPRESRLLTEVGPKVAAGADLAEIEAWLLEWFADFARDEAYEAGAARIRAGVQALDPTSPGLTRALFALVLEAVACVRDPGQARCFLEKTPKNEAHFDEMFRAFPTARVIYLVRDPRAVYLSNKRAEAFRMEPGFAARQWVKSLRSVLRQVVKFGGAERILVVRYEDLVARPAPTLASVCDFIGVATSEALVRPTAGGRPWRGNSYGEGSQGSGVIEAARAEAWRGEITAEENAAILGEARFEMTLLGYAIGPDS